MPQKEEFEMTFINAGRRTAARPATALGARWPRGFGAAAGNGVQAALACFYRFLSACKNRFLAGWLECAVLPMAPMA
jgi:hypothetical protein